MDNLLAAAVPDGVTTVILTLRADFYARCAEFANLRTCLAQQQNYIGSMASDELRAAIEKPATLTGWDYEPGLVEVMLKDVAGEAGALPLLSHALLETWRRRRGHTLTFSGYHAAGGVRGAIAYTADSVYNDLPAEQQEITRNIFLRLTALGEGTQDTRRRVPLPELLGRDGQTGQVQAVLKRLEDERLVTAERGESAPGTAEAIYVDVTHEALIREWPRLGSWLHEDREGLLVHRRLTEAAQEWVQLGRDSGALLRGVRLAQTAEWAAAHDAALNDLERELVIASRAQAEAEQRETERIQREREEAQRRELAQAQQLARETEARRKVEEQSAEQAKRDAARLRKNVQYLIGTVVVALGLAGVAWYFFGRAQANLELAQAQLARQEGFRLLQKTTALAATGHYSEAIATYQQAIAADPTLPVDAETAITGTIRSTATQLVQAGEALARNGDYKGASAKFRQAQALKPPADTPIYVWIEPGQFVMGSTEVQCKVEGVRGCSVGEQPTHTVQLDGYWLLRTEVTNEQYKRCVDAGVCAAPGVPSWDKPPNAKKPVIYVDWNQAKTYAHWVGGRLPTEAEWESACRGSDSRIYPWGNQQAAPERLNHLDSHLGGAIDVGSYAAGANGLYDMAGNVLEWTADWYDDKYYATSPANNPKGPESGATYTLRGGSWYIGGNLVRCAYRYDHVPVVRNDNVGFRVVSPGL